MSQTSVPVPSRRYIQPPTSAYGPAGGGSRAGRSGGPGQLPGNRPGGLPGGTLADKRSHAKRCLSAREPCRSLRMPKPALAPGPNTGAGGRLRGKRRTRPPGRGRIRAAGRAVSLVSADSARGCSAVPAGRVLAAPPRRPVTRRGRADACADVASPAPGDCPVRGPPPARLPLRVRTPAVTLRSLRWPARRSVPRRPSVAHLP